MFCENCKKRPATMRMTLGKQDGEQQTIMLCGMCAHRFRAVVPSRMALGAHSGGQLSPEVFSQHQFPTQRYGVFAGFSRQTQEVLREAEKTARGQGLQAVGTGPLLYGIMQLGYSPALHALEKNGVHKEELEATIPPSVSELENTDQPIQLSPDTLSVLEMAQNEAAGLNDTFVEPEHIILGMLELENVSATQWMRNHGVDFGCLERDILESLSRGRPPADDRFMNILEATPEEILLGPDTSTGPGTSTRKALLAYARDLTALAKAGKMMPVVGREAEVGRVIRILSRLQKNNPLLLGKAGVGKTAIVEALAQQIVAGDVPRRLRGASLYQVDLTAMLAGTEMRGEFEKRVKGLLDEVSGRSDCILFIDEIHTLLGAGATEGSLDAGNMMKPALARGELRLIGATTTSEHSKYIERDPALSRRFQPVLVGEPTVEQAIFILEGIKGRFESHHGVSVSDEAISAAVTLSAQYLTDRFLPDKAIDLIDESASMVAIENDDTAESRVVIADDVARVISSWTGIPLTKLVESEKQRLLDMEGIIHRRIINQDEAVGVVSDVVRRSRAGLRDPGRPNGAFIFAGPTGVGKTELARALAEFIFNDERALIRLDMSEYTEAESVSRLIGAPPGYVGFEQGGQLTEKVKFQPYSVVLLDEMEKAHPRVLNVLLQIADAGRLTDGQGREVNFKNTIIILTTNIGSHLYFASGNTEEPAALKEQVIDLIVKSTSPELINRMDAVILFEALTLEQVREIIGLHLERLARRLAERSINLELGEGAVDYLAGKGFDPEMGARPAKRVIQNELESPLSGMILDGSLGDGQTAVVSAAGDHLEITVAA